MTLEEFASQARRLGFYRVLRRTPDGPEYATWTTMCYTHVEDGLGGDGAWHPAENDDYTYTAEELGIIEVGEYVEPTPAFPDVDLDDLGEAGPQSLLGDLSALEGIFMANLEEGLANLGAAQLAPEQRQAVINEVQGMLDHVYDVIGSLPAIQGPLVPAGLVRLELPL